MTTLTVWHFWRMAVETLQLNGRIGPRRFGAGCNLEVIKANKKHMG